MLDVLFFYGDSLDDARFVLSVLSLCAGVYYLRYVSAAPGRVRTFLKTMVVGILVPVPFTYLATVPDANAALISLALALGLSAAGDFFLAMEDQGKFFKLGLASFLLAHVAFVAAFSSYAWTFDVMSISVLIVALGAAGALLWKIYPNLGSLKVPVFAYFSVIMVMVATALSVTDAHWALGAGALIFALSDSLIAVRKFWRPWAWINQAIWVTYVAAQYMMTAAILQVIVR